jgi:hypothetical protein
MKDFEEINIESDLSECWTCSVLFNRFGSSVTDCDNCKTKEAVTKALSSIGKRVSVCCSAIPGHWSPIHRNGKVIAHLVDGKVLIKLDNGKKIKTSDYSIYSDQNKYGIQTNLFQQ